MKNTFFIQKMFVLKIKYKYFLNIYSFSKKVFLIIKDISVKTSLSTQKSGPWSLKFWKHPICGIL